MAETVVLYIRKFIKLAGFHPLSGKWGIQVLLFVLGLTVLIVNSVLYVVYNWDDKVKRLEGVKGLVLYLICVMYFLSLTSHWEETTLLINTIGNGLYKCSYPSTAKNMETKHKIESDMEKLRSFWYYMLSGYVILACITPALIFILLMFQNKGNITADMLRPKLPFHYPENVDTLTLPIMAYVIQCHFFMSGTLKGYIVFVATFNSMQMITGELVLLRQSLEEVDSLLAVGEGTVQDVKHLKNAITLKEFMKNFLNHHYHIQGMVKTVTRGMQLVAFSNSSGMSVLLCTSIYTLARTNDVMIIMNEAIYSSVLILALYCYGLMGEKISTQDEKLRAALYEYTWVDKPLWFRKSLLIIMTRTTRTIEMKSSGLFALNLRNFLSTLQAAYSYFNILTSLR